MLRERSIAIRVNVCQELRWLLGLSGTNPQFSQQRSRFRLLEDYRHYYHLPQASMILQRFREPTAFAPDATALGGYTFFGNGIVTMIEALHHGGGWRMIRWLQERHERLITHDVLHKNAKTFLERQGFGQLHLPFPPEAVDHARDMVLMAWPAEAQDKAWIQDQRVASDVAWWLAKRRLRYEDRSQAAQERSSAFFDQMMWGERFRSSANAHSKWYVPLAPRLCIMVVCWLARHEAPA